MLKDDGGHLISVSEDGTIAVTNLNSDEIHNKTHNFTINMIEKPRTDNFMEERNENIKNRRRNSINFTYSRQFKNYFSMVKAKSEKVFNYCAFGNIDKILDIKNLREI